ncbi:MAG: hypothetical protein PUD65_07585 [Spirochaetales bacterium]|nr:hypothetical protein [Spirochaetales bacterium]
MKKIAFVLLVIIVMLVGTSCVHHYPYEPEYWFQALGEDGEYVLTADVKRLQNGEGKEIVDPSILSNPIASKASRISLSLIAEDKDEDTYPLPLSSFVVSGAIEGKYSPFIINNSLKFSGAIKVKENGFTRYKSGAMSIYAPMKNLILFSEGDYDYLYERTIGNRWKYIDDETASAMASSLFSLYVFSPETLVDIGFEIPQTVLSEMTRTCILFDEKDGVLVMSGRIETTGDGTARALSTLFKNQIVQEKRRNGEKLDTKALSGMFTTKERIVIIDGYPLSGEMKEKAKSLMTEGIGGLF